MTPAGYLESVRQRLVDHAGYVGLHLAELPADASQWAWEAYSLAEPGLRTLVAVGPAGPMERLAQVREALLQVASADGETLVVMAIVTVRRINMSVYESVQGLTHNGPPARLVPWVVDLEAGRLFEHNGPPFGVRPDLPVLLAPASPEPEPAEESEADSHAGGRPVFRPVVTYTLLAMIGAVWMLMTAAGGSLNATRSVELLEQWGAVARPDLWLTGEYWRLFTAAFLHIGLEHLFMNGISLWSVGRVVEFFFGRSKMLVIYVVAAVAGSALSAVIGRPIVVSAGASGAIFGLLGAVIWYRMSSPAARHIPWRPLLITLGINLAFGLLLHDMIDNWNHLGGLLGGFVAAFAVGAPKSPNAEAPRLRLPRFVRVGLSGVLLGTSVALVTGLLVLPGPGHDLAHAIEAHQAGQFGAAAEGYKAALNRQPNEPELRRLLVEAHLLAGNCNEARTELETLRRSSPYYRNLPLLQEAARRCGE